MEVDYEKRSKNFSSQSLKFISVKNKEPLLPVTVSDLLSLPDGQEQYQIGASYFKTVTLNLCIIHTFRCE